MSLHFFVGLDVMLKRSLTSIAAFCGIFLTACGGGGGSSSVADVSLGGSFSKGLYANAEVQAYEVVNGALVAIGSKTTTNASGEYTLTLKPTSNPVVVEMTTTAATTMMDETNNFQASTPMVGTKIRTMVSELTTSMPAVHGNVFTEMAVSGAKNSTAGLTAASIAASKALVQSATGIDPFSVKPVGSTSATMDSSQEKLMTLMTAMMLEAKNTAGSCSGDSTGVSCLVTTLNNKAALTVNSSAGTYGVTDAAGLNSYLTAKMTALNTYTPTSDPGGFVAKMKSNSSIVSAAMSVPTAISASDASNRQGLDSFMQAMRGGFNEAEKTIKARNDAAKLRLDKLVFLHVGDGLKVLGNAMDACSTTTGTLICTTGDTSIFSAASSGYTFTYDVTIDGFRAPVSGTAVYRYSGSIAGTYSSDSGVASATITASKTKISDSSKMSEINILLNADGIKNDSLSKSIDVNALTVKGYDQTANSSKWAQISLTGARLSVNRPAVSASGGLKTLTVVAPLTFSTSDGDVVSGKINSLIGKEKITGSPLPTSKDIYPTSVDLSLDIAVHEGALLGMSLVASQNIDAYNPDLPSTSSNQANGSILMTFKLADNVSANLTATKSTYDKTNFDMKITSNGNWIDLAGKTKRTDLSIDNETLDGDIVVTSSGVYTANLRKSSGRVQGEILKSGQQIGVVVDDVIKVGGVEVSIR